ncbi:hypothetical protein [Nocardia gipuzkoensis]|uniref:hypothetical protein n=1 Tax=Nocardia gipuzkoensis TaxID=2749991 RepID=UPI003EE1E344
MNVGHRNTAWTRHIALPVIIVGLFLHLWLGTMIGLALAALGLAVHVLAAALGGRRILRHRPLR